MSIFFPQQEIEKATDSEKERPTLRCVHFDPEARLMLAADGFILAAVPFHPSDEGLPCDIDRTDMGLLRQGGCIELQTSEKEVRAILCNSEEAPGDYPAVVLEREEYNFPSYGFAMEALEESENVRPDFAVDGNLLMRLIQAVTMKGNHRGIKVWLGKSPSGPIVVKPFASEGFGIIMPMNICYKLGDDQPDKWKILKELGAAISGSEPEVAIKGSLLEKLRSVLA